MVNYVKMMFKIYFPLKILVIMMKIHTLEVFLCQANFVVNL